ncbi:hypothetical protein CC80DRAFT_278685 [Byssothecium circinans]|uniref:Uncharacterized protein n=1 Tax=Byssothecium circinans TaxID=147558 RepID=A0A6A5TC11_9PLEO|nr:hypothetical protein CC80DRAFT_278685 [Byssothecium circinans]
MTTPSRPARHSLRSACLQERNVLCSMSIASKTPSHTSTTRCCCASRNGWPRSEAWQFAFCATCTTATVASCRHGVVIRAAYGRDREVAILNT